MPYRWRCTRCRTTQISEYRPCGFSTCCVQVGGEFKRYSNHSWQREEWVEPGSGGCFITTAVCQTLGAPDDCKELTMIRNFRDSRLRPFMKDGELLVKEYYRIGPMIVEAINKDADASSIYTQLWNDRLKLCCEQIEQKNWEQAKLIYIKMVRELCEKYNIEVDPTIKESYFF